VHRVVEARGSGPREVVVEVVRPGYRLGERVVREAEVVVERRT
jgi:molecular chaperone GrpE (heat shock protein)